MDILLDEIEKALSADLHLVALQATLALPDICGALESANGIATKASFCNWYDQYAAKHTRCDNMTAEDCYLFRCSLLHQGSTLPSPRPNQTASFSRILFCKKSTYTLHNNVMHDALNIDLEVFCYGIIKSVREWQEIMEKTENINYLKNYSKMIRAYYEGLTPYTYGILTIT